MTSLTYNHKCTSSTKHLLKKSALQLINYAINEMNANRPPMIAP